MSTDKQSNTGAAAASRREGVYVTIEGIDGCGKSTLLEGLRGRFPDAMFTEEPKAGLWTGEACREAFRRDTGPYTDALLLMADRAEHLHRFVEPALGDGNLVISDRSSDSTYAYQSRRVGVDDAHGWFDDVLGPFDVEPDLTLWIDVPVDTAMERVDGEEKYERRETLEEVRRNYQLLNMRHSDRYYRMDGAQSREELLDEAAGAIEGLLR